MYFRFVRLHVVCYPIMYFRWLHVRLKKEKLVDSQTKINSIISHQTY